MTSKAPAQLKAACKSLQLGQVSLESWKALKQAEAAFSLDLQVDIEHLSVSKLEALSSALGAADSAGADIWDWLLLPASAGADPEGGGGNLARASALVALLGQACGNSTELVCSAGAAYLSLLACEGADRQWSALFQPNIFRHILHALRVLRRGDLKTKRVKKQAEAAAGDEGAGEELEDDAPGEQHDKDEAIGVVAPKDALQLLEALGPFFVARSIGSKVEVASMAIEELAMLVKRPREDSVARQASTALTALVTSAGTAEEVRKASAACIRGLMPALLMTQDRLTSFNGTMPRQLQQARATALNFICGLVQERPELLTRTFALPEKVPEEEKGEGQGVKRRRGAGKKLAAEDDNSEGDEEMDLSGGVDGGAGAGKPLEEAATPAKDAGSGEKEVRRRRPRGQGSDDPIVATLELMCVQCPERAEWRSYLADAVVALLCEAATVEHKQVIGSKPSARRLCGKTADPQQLEPGSSSTADAEMDGPALPLVCSQDDRPDSSMAGTLVSVDGSFPAATTHCTAADRFISFLERILESERVSTRVLATEVAVSALEHSGKLAAGGGGAAGDARAALVKKFLIALLRRCCDGVSTVRCRALGGVATALQFLAKSEDGRRLLHNVVLEPTHHQHVDLARIFRQAATDERPMVRRAALSFMDAVLGVLQAALGQDSKALITFFDLNSVAGLSADESIMVRKACISSLALLLRLCPLRPVCGLWVRNVLPLVLDVEATVAERALDELEAAVFNPLTEDAAGAAKGSLAGLPGVVEDLDSEATEFLQRGLRQIAKRNEGKFPRRFVDALVRRIKSCLVEPLPPSQWQVAVWSMLEEVTAFDPSGSGALKFQLILQAWNTFCDPGKSRGSLGSVVKQHAALGARVLRVLENVVPSASLEDSEALMESLSEILLSFAVPAAMICNMMCVVNRIEEVWKAKKVYKERAEGRAAFRRSLLRHIQTTLAEWTMPADPSARDAVAVAPQRLEACLFTLGELAVLDISIISSSIITQVQTIATNTIFSNGERVETCPGVRGQAFAALGKFCLRKDTLAKKSVELLALHLNSCESFVVRNNVLIVLGDLCTHYTSLVDRFVPCMTGLLKDSNELLRKQAAMILAGLISEDFIKFRGSLMLRFLFVLSDPSHAVRSFVECVFARILHQRNTAMFSQNFLDVICSLNGWLGLPNFQGAAGNDEFSLLGSPSRRSRIYSFMLSLMSNDQKFNVCAQLVTTLLASFVDAEAAVELPKNLSCPAGEALSDGLALLCCKEMRICFSPPQQNMQDEDGEGAASADAARGVLGNILKRNMCENIIPVMVQLKNLMEAQRSPFLRQLRHCLREMLRDFKDDLPSMLPGDVQLAQEITYDLEEQCDHGGPGSASAGERVVEQRALVAQLTGASRRMTLGRMLAPVQRAEGAATALSQECAEAEGCAAAEEGAVAAPCQQSSRQAGLPKVRRSSLGAAAQPGLGTSGGAGAAVTEGEASARPKRRRQRQKGQEEEEEEEQQPQQQQQPQRPPRPSPEKHRTLLPLVGTPGYEEEAEEEENKAESATHSKRRRKHRTGPAAAGGC